MGLHRWWHARSFGPGRSSSDWDDALGVSLRAHKNRSWCPSPSFTREDDCRGFASALSCMRHALPLRTLPHASPFPSIRPSCPFHSIPSRRILGRRMKS